MLRCFYTLTISTRILITDHRLQERDRGGTCETVIIDTDTGDGDLGHARPVQRVVVVEVQRISGTIKRAVLNLGGVPVSETVVGADTSIEATVTGAVLIQIDTGGVDADGGADTIVTGSSPIGFGPQDTD